MSDQYGTIIVSPKPAGRFIECIVSGTPKPGTCMTVLAATEPIGGIFTYEVYNRAADSERTVIAVLLEDESQGKDVLTAYTTLNQGRLYFPLPGDSLQMLIADVGGTADTFAIGDILIVDDGTGLLLTTTGSPEIEPFVMMETLVALTADTLARCLFTGN